MDALLDIYLGSFPHFASGSETGKIFILGQVTLSKDKKVMVRMLLD